jgi:cytochrome oxidase assembly protein ShyY1
VPTLLAPRFWALHLAALLCAGAAGWLGVWQYDAWQTRRSYEATDLTLVQPVGLRSVIGPDDPFPGDKVGQPVVLDGTWVPRGTVYVSGREHDGHLGYWAVTPLAVGGASAPAIPVVRGWTAHVADAPRPPTGRARMVGWLQPTEGTGQVDTNPDDDVLPQLRIADVIQHVDQDLYGAYAVVADRAAPGHWPVGAAATNPGTDGLAPAALAQLPDAGRFTAVRNLFYALEWWFFGGFALFIWWRWMRDERAPDGDGDGDGDETGNETGATAPGTPGTEASVGAVDGQ